MRIDGTHSLGVYAPARQRKRSEEDGFSLGGKDGGTGRVASHAATGLAGLDSVLALQGYEERGDREETLRHGNQVLDLLEELKVALLEGGDGGGRLDHLAALLADSPAATGDEGLDEAIAAVDLRARVELAKRGR